MFLASGLLLLVGLALSDCKVYNQTLKVWGENDDLAKIVNGHATKPNAYPFIVSLDITFNGDATYGCGGALINPSYILTAAHCVVDDEGGEVTEIKVLLGAHNLKQREANRITRYADNFVTADYNPRGHANDVALIHLSKPVTFNQYIKPICLAPAGSSYLRQTATVAGWGAIGTDMPSSDILLEIKLPVLYDSICAQAYGRSYSNSVMLCAGYTDGTGDSCQGDSGGPLFVKSVNGFTSIGVVSFGMGCADPGYPGVYAEVQSFAGWIRENAADGGSLCIA